ncbi:MAG: transporter [Thermodesulfobacteriota bacterium]|nr:transporter [Thermodesulfobacteriota bacterium]
MDSLADHWGHSHKSVIQEDWKVNEANPSTGKWLNRNVFAFGLTSFLSDFCHEMATSVLPQFMQTIGASAAALGFIEGVADAISSFVKLGAGYHSDKIGHRKTWTVFGYILTAMSKAVFAFAFAWPLILIGRSVGWLGRGIRGPLRDAMLAESVSPQDRGKAFGFHRMGDTAGAVAGPLAAFGLLTWIANHPGMMEALWRWVPMLSGAPGGDFRVIFLLTLVPGILSVISIVMVTEKRRAPKKGMRLMGNLRAMPKDYRQFLLAVGIFGMADFAPTLMILRATTVMEPQMGLIEASRLAALFYLLRNIFYAVASYPIGALSDRFSRSRYLAVGYGVAVLTFMGFALVVSSIWWFILFFSLAGIFIAWEDTVEGIAVRDYVDDTLAGTAYGVLGVVNGIGDFVSSFMVGLLWAGVGPAWGFAYAVIVGLLGVFFMARVSPGGGSAQSEAP